MNDQLGCRDQLRVTWIFGAQPGFAAVHHEGFERAFVVDQRCDHVAGVRRQTVFANDEITLDDVFANHRIAAHLQGKGPRGGFDAERLHVYGDAAFRLLPEILGKTRWNRAQHRNVHHAAAKFVQRRDHPMCPGTAGFMNQEPLAPQRAHMIECGVHAVKTKVGRNLTKAGRMSLGLLVALNEVENLLLSFGQSIHTGHLTSIIKHPPSQDHRESSCDEQREPTLAATALLRYRWFNMKMLSVIALVSLFAFRARADVVTTNQDARAILARVLANRPSRDFSLKARLFVGHADAVPVDILMKNTADETRTIYRAGQTAALIVQPVHGAPTFYVRGQGQLTGTERTKKFLGSDFTYYDLGLPFLHWPTAQFLGEERVRGRDCYAIESTADGEPYARVKMWIDKEFFALLKAEAFDAKGTLLRRFAVTSFKKIGDFWIPRGLEEAELLPGQALPSEEKSRLEIYEGNYDTTLPAEEFSRDQYKQQK